MFAFPDGAQLRLQINFCKNPNCVNYGVPVTGNKWERMPPSNDSKTGGYQLSGVLAEAAFKCKACNEYPPLKSNSGVVEELARITKYCLPKEVVSCTNEACPNHNKSKTEGRYKRAGKTSQGSQRYQCLECGKTFSVSARVTLRQRYPRLNTQVMALLLNKSPLSRICEVLDISPKTLYNRIDFIHEQCLVFAAKKEKELPAIAKGKKLYISVDRQDYIVNWSRRKDRRNLQLRAIGSADLNSGYVFGMHLNFDPSLERDEIEGDAEKSGDYSRPMAHRKYARLWLGPDYEVAVDASATKKRRKALKAGATVEDDVGARYAEALSRPDIESSELPSKEQALPNYGMQVRSEYTMYAHFYWLRHLLRDAEKVRFFMDQESGIRAACLSAFEKEIKARKCDALYVRLGKDMTVGEKRQAQAEAKDRFNAAASAFPEGTPKWVVEVAMMKEEMARASSIGSWKDRWVSHPLPNGAEPLKAICYLTDYKDYDEDHQARLFLKATLHPIDRFFMLLRRRVNMLERSLSTASKAGRQWHGYSAYQPGNIEKLLDTFRTYYNFGIVGGDKKTPAMRLGLTDRVYSKAEILNME